MKPQQHKRRPAQGAGLRLAAKQGQRGVTLLFGMIALAVMMIGAAAMVRSMNAAMLMSGNLGFGRDLTNQAERASAAVGALVSTGALAGDAARQSSLQGSNYSAIMLPTTPQGIPTALANDTQFANVGVAGNDIMLPAQSVTVRYVLDRMCTTAAKAADLSHCAMQESLRPKGHDASTQNWAEADSTGGAGAMPMQALYRLSIRVTGPRNTQAFFQTTFAL